jgi:hypothetical protein
MGVSEEPVRIYLFRQNPVFTSLHLLRCFAFQKSFFFYFAEEAFDIILMTHPSSVGALPRICHPVPPDFDPRKDAGRVSNEEQVCVQFFCYFFATFLASNQKYGC